MKKYLFIITLLVMTFVFSPGVAYMYASESESIYGHISYAEGNPKVIRADRTLEDAIVNLPVAPGDMIVTGDKSKCELQFDNGTIMRLGKNSRLKVTTVLAQSLTSSWKITTLKLTKGKLYSINQSYNRERFQIITPNTAIHLKNNSISTIHLREGETHIFCDRGKFKVMYGGKVTSLKTVTIQKGDGYSITTDHQLIKNGQRDIEFLSWNKYIDKHFRELHYGISKLPKKIYKYPRGIVHWAEKWSTIYGEWIYDELLGYVWKPADERFAHSARPFFHAKFTWINNQLFLVPAQPWGWTPAHLGTWVWMKWGWTWIPGASFSTGIKGILFPYSPMFRYSQFYYAPTLAYWIRYIYGGFNLYYTYRTTERRVWQDAYEDEYKKKITEPSMENVPTDIRTIIKKLNKAPVAHIKKRLRKPTPEMMRPISLMGKLIKRTTPKLPVKTRPHKPVIKTVKSSPVSIINKMKRAAPTKKSSKKNVKVYRDWNPDKKWSLHRGVNIHYSSKTNEVVCRELGLSSNKMTPAKIHVLRNSSLSTTKGGDKFNPSGGYKGSGSSSSSTDTGTHGSIGSGGGKGSGGGGKSRGGSTSSDSKGDEGDK